MMKLIIIFIILFFIYKWLYLILDVINTFIIHFYNKENKKQSFDHNIFILNKQKELNNKHIQGIPEVLLLLDSTSNIYNNYIYITIQLLKLTLTNKTCIEIFKILASIKKNILLNNDQNECFLTENKYSLIKDKLIEINKKILIPENEITNLIYLSHAYIHGYLHLPPITNPVIEIEIEIDETIEIIKKENKKITNIIKKIKDIYKEDYFSTFNYCSNITTLIDIKINILIDLLNKAQGIYTYNKKNF